MKNNKNFLIRVYFVQEDNEIENFIAAYTWFVIF